MQNATVLVVEDDTHLLSGIRDILELEEYQVWTAQNGVEGLELLRSNPDTPPDIIVSDIMMPQMDGFTFLREVQKDDRWVSIPFIFLTAKSEKKDRHEGTMMGADIYLTKPFDAKDLLVAVAGRLQRRRSMTRVQDNEVSNIKRKILNILNHEMRTPLTLVVAYADMLKDFDPENMSEDDIMLFLRGVNSGADRLRRLIENFIVLVEIDSGDAAKTYGWRKKPIDDMTPIIRDARRQTVDVLPDGECHLYVADDLPTFTADREFFTVILRELMDNAVKFSDNTSVPPEVHITHEGDYIVIRAMDQGRGIPEHELDNIWQAFYQIKREHYEDQGAGSGLAIVAGLTKIHQGDYMVESTFGEGSVFTIRIPCEPPPNEAPASDAPPLV